MNEYIINYLVTIIRPCKTAGALAAWLVVRAPFELNCLIAGIFRLLAVTDQASFLTLDELRAAHLSATDLLKQLVFDAVTKQQLTAGKMANAAAPKITKLSQIDLA